MNEVRNIHDEGLSPAARAALAALRADDDVPDAARERVWARVERAPALLDMSQGTGSSRGRWGGAAIVLAIAAGLALAVVELGRGALAIAQAPRGEAARYDGGAAGERTAQVGAAGPGRAVGSGLSEGTGAAGAAGAPGLSEGTGVAGPGVGVAVPEDRSSEAVLEDRSSEAVPEDRARGGAGARGAGAAEAVPGDSSSLAAEAALLQRAQTALAAGDPEAALARLGEHARGFKDGVLARERDALRVTALCAAGRVGEGRAEAAAFLAAHAGSLLAERVRGACEGR
ncbi:hypothetical protein [Nannocystis sp.]|uniref:hypothetical protein n=1 Tax=Nannocystis sp. TaxID=1962667 RepID=UPI0025F0BFBD|nr:hypothetical protein [Nannocystis sp.]MBK7825909.1 hypothetical protein [Nannocystis sp.]